MLARETQRETRKKEKKKKKGGKRGREKEQGKSTLDSTTSMLVFMAFSVNTITLSTTKHDFFISLVGLMWEERGEFNQPENTLRKTS